MLNTKTFILILGFCCVLFTASAQRGDTTIIKEIKLENLTISGAEKFLLPRGIGLYNIEKLFEPQTKGYRFYQNLVWPAPQKMLDPTKIKFEMKLDPSVLLNINNRTLNTDYLNLDFKYEPISSGYYLFAFVASRFLNRAIGVDKQARIDLTNAIYAKPGFPASVKDPFNSTSLPNVSLYNSNSLGKNKNAKFSFHINAVDIKL